MSEQAQQLVEGISNLLSPKQLAYTAWETAWKGNLIRFGIITALLLGACIALLTTFSVMGISNDWPRQRCSPLFMPFAELLGYDASENFKFCITNLMQEQSSDFFAPIYAMLGDYGSSIKVVIDTINGFRKILGTFKLSVNQYFGSVAAKIQSLLFQVRLSFMKMQTLMGRVYGTFYSIIWMGSSAMTAGLSLSDNSLVNFMFDFCFHPDTRIRMADGSERAIRDVRIGDVLEGNHRVTSTFRLCGRNTPMVQIGSDILSGSHMVQENGHWIPAHQHSAALPTSSIPILICLNVEGHVFSLASGLHVADYDESSDNAVEAVVQSIAERAVNGSSSSPHVRPDYDLGFDRDCLVQLHDGSWKAAEGLEIGDRIVGYQEILGVVLEECTPVVYQGFLIAPGQLVHWNGSWVRAGTVGTPLETPTNLIQFITDRTGPIAIRKEVDLWVRDYREVPLPEMEDPYLQKMKSSVVING